MVKSAVNQAATEIAREYLNEISPYVGAVRLESLFSLLPSNILTRDEVERLFRVHTRRSSTTRPAPARAACFCTLFKAGLLGYVGVDLVSSQRVQRFVMPGERTFDPDGVLPESTHYLVHPVLSEIISRANPKYVQNIDELNVVGNGRAWREADEERPLCVLHADIRAFSALMDHPRLEDSVRQMLPVVVDRHASHCQLTEITGGDSLTIVHHDPNGLVKAAKRIMEDLFEAEGHPVLRVAIDYGNVRVNAQTPSGHTVRSGSPSAPPPASSRTWRRTRSGSPRASARRCTERSHSTTRSRSPAAKRPTAAGRAGGSTSRRSARTNRTVGSRYTGSWSRRSAGADVLTC